MVSLPSDRTRTSISYIQSFNKYHWLNLKLANSLAPVWAKPSPFLYGLLKRPPWGWRDGSSVKSTYLLLLQRKWMKISAPTRWLITICNSTVKGSDALFRLPWVPGTHMVHIYLCRQNSHRHKMKI